MENLEIASLLPMIVGIFVLLILFLLFAGGLLEGTLFPKVNMDILKCHANVAPLDGANLAKLFVWSFIAGFAEKLVPDRLQRIAAGAESSAPSKEANRGSTAGS